MTTSLPFTEIPLAPADPILGINAAFTQDTRPQKVNLSVGYYYDENGVIPVLKTVAEAEKRLLSNGDLRGYLPIDGLARYNQSVQALVFGDEGQARKDGRVVTIQTPGGTGALRVGAEFVRRFTANARVFISNPSWENHQAVFEAANLQVQLYPYYDPTTNGLSFGPLCASLAQAPEGSVVLLHASCHNPTGSDLTVDAWRELLASVVKRHLLPFFDCAYQGLGVGLTEDVASVRLCVERGISCFVASSGAKNFSLYAQRVGALSLVTSSKDEATRALSQLKRIARTMYSNPPAHGVRLVDTILADSALRTQWEGELTGMRQRIAVMREDFAAALHRAGISRDFSFITQQRGMFSYTGITGAAVKRLRDEFGIYMLESGRICVAALNAKNLPIVCDAIAKVLR